MGIPLEVWNEISFEDKLLIWDQMFRGRWESFILANIPSPQEPKQKFQSHDTFLWP